MKPNIVMEFPQRKVAVYLYQEIGVWVVYPYPQSE